MCTADLLSVAEAAALLHTSKMTVYRLIHAGLLPATQTGRRFHIDRADLVEHLPAEPDHTLAE